MHGSRGLLVRRIINQFAFRTLSPLYTHTLYSVPPAADGVSASSVIAGNRLSNVSLRKRVVEP